MGQPPQPIPPDHLGLVGEDHNAGVVRTVPRGHLRHHRPHQRLGRGARAGDTKDTNITECHSDRHCTRYWPLLGGLPHRDDNNQLRLEVGGTEPHHHRIRVARAPLPQPLRRQRSGDEDVVGSGVSNSAPLFLCGEFGGQGPFRTGPRLLVCTPLAARGSRSAPPIGDKVGEHQYRAEQREEQIRGVVLQPRHGATEHQGSNDGCYRKRRLIALRWSRRQFNLHRRHCGEQTGWAVVCEATIPRRFGVRGRNAVARPCQRGRPDPKRRALGPHHGFLDPHLIKVCSIRRRGIFDQHPLGSCAHNCMPTRYRRVLQCDGRGLSADGVRTRRQDKYGARVRARYDGDRQAIDGRFRCPRQRRSQPNDGAIAHSCRTQELVRRQAFQAEKEPRSGVGRRHRPGDGRLHVGDRRRPGRRQCDVDTITGNAGLDG